MTPETATTELQKPIEKIKVGNTASEVLLQILQTHPEIETISIGSYDPTRNSHVDVHFVLGKEVHANTIDLQKLSSLAELYKWCPISKAPDPQPEWALVVTSIVILKDGTSLHIPMMDFSCPPSSENLHRVTQAISAYGPGYILNSGQSYHFWGTRLLPPQAWSQFMRYCSLFNDPLFDKRYIQEYIHRGYTALRLFAHPPLKPTEPHVVAIVD